MDFIGDSALYDSSGCQSTVYYIEKGAGFYLKTGAPASLAPEAMMTDFFHKKGFTKKIVSYTFAEGEPPGDFLITEKLIGVDCRHPAILAQPERLCDILSENLRRLHETDITDLPPSDGIGRSWQKMEANFKAGSYEAFDEKTGMLAAYEELSGKRHLLKNEVLTHGDYCLPNVILEDFRFKGFIDLGEAGLGDRHTDIFWGLWSLWFNLGTDKYAERFIDGYGRALFDPERLRVVELLASFNV